MVDSLKESENPDLEILRGRTVLLVEDDSVNQLVAVRMLEKLDCTVVIANNGQEAVDIALSGDKEFDFILMDIIMPVMSGFKATRYLRENGVTTPIIAHTSAFKPEERQEFETAGFDELAYKNPTDIAVIAAAVKRVLGK
ncbi:response regulator [Patescibacteria group bacterium]